MKVTLNWLKQYVDFNWSPEELAERLTMLGLEVEGVQKLAGEFEGIVVGQVLTRDKVPGSDKLSVCRVNDGHGERQIICGANNFKPTDKVALILPGAALPLKPGEKEPFVIKERKVFGIVSQGMMCSPQELGLPDDIDGILILREDAKLGQPFAEYLGRSAGDVVYDLEVTPNRPDLNSVIGIAREISALTGNPLRVPATGIAEGATALVGAAPGTTVDNYVAVRIDDPELCPRYTARIIREVKVGPSPDWLRQTLEKVGLRSISNVVDVTNYVMLETGQPLHAFDYHLIAKSSTGKPTIVIRRAGSEEKFVTLDGQGRSLTNEMLLIADETKGIALAGIMGGQNSEINQDTKDVLIESAYFNPTNIRRTSKKLELRTESSYRFERGADIGISDYASQRAVQLILETAGGDLVPGLVDAHPRPIEWSQITLRHEKVDQLVGVAIPAADQVRFLQRLGLELLDRKLDAPSLTDPLSARSAIFRIPTFRVDLKREIDLIEEVVRLYGVDKIPATPPRGAIGANPFDSVHDRLVETRRILLGLGLTEAQGQTLFSSAEFESLKTGAVLLANPLSADMDMLRPSLLMGLIHALRHNLNRKNDAVALFEIGRVFTRADGKVNEERRVGIALTGPRLPVFWSGEDRQARFDAHDVKGIVEELIEHSGLRGVAYTKREDRTGLFVESAAISLGGKVPLGEFGQLSPALAKKYDLRDAVFLAEVRLDELIARGNPSRSFKALAQFPAVRRDVAMLVPEPTTHENVLSAVKQAKPPNLEGVELFDVFRGKNVPEGQKSMAYAFTYRHGERTLTDAEVNAAHEKLVEQFKQRLQASIR